MDASANRPTTVTIEFLEKNGGTELILTHRHPPGTQIESHRMGWTDIARMLDATLTAGSASD